jgi:hypothetical protein
MSKLVIPLFALLVILFVVSRCQQRHESLFFEDCGCTKLNLEHGHEITDSLNLFSVTFPDDSWHPIRYVGPYGSQIIGGQLEEGNDRYFTVRASPKLDLVGSTKEEAQRNSDRSYANVKTGQIEILGDSCYWNLQYQADYFPRTYTIQVDIIEHDTEINYSIALAAEENKNYQKRICEMESMIYSLKILK